MDFKQRIIHLLNRELNIDASSLLEIPPSPELGDYAFPCFTLAKTFKKAPQQIAEELAKKLPKTAFLEKIETKGPYLNFFVSKQAFIQETLTKTINQKLQKRKETILVEYSSPNIAKPFGLGHLMTTVIGNSLAKHYKELGYKVVSINHLGDWGTQFGKLIVAYKKWGSSSKLNKDPIKYLLELYLKFHEEAKADLSLEMEARSWFNKLEQGNKEATALWRKFSALSLKEFKKLYKELNISFDVYRGESAYQKDIAKIISLLEKKSLLKESEGALIVDLQDLNLGVSIIKKSDESSLYITRDIAAALYRHEKYHFEKSIYVTDMRQNLHFKQLMAILKLAGLEFWEKMVHVDYGLMKMESGIMSTREGRMVFVEDLLKTAEESVLKIMKEKKQKPSKEIAAKVGYGAVFFWILAHDRHKDLLFNWDEVLDYNGETGPYLQYTYVRARSILKKAKFRPGKADLSLLKEVKEFRLAKHLARFREVIEATAESHRPNLLARYLLDLAQLFNEYYQDVQCITGNKELTLARATLVNGCAQILSKGLGLLGINCPERM